MKPESITGARNFCVCFASDGFEAGISCFQSSGSTYIAWERDGIVVRVGGSTDSWDELFTILINENLDAATWLISQHPPLVHPKETILALVSASVIDAEVSGETICVPLLPSSRLSALSKLLQFYGWDILPVGSHPIYDRKFEFPDK